MASSREYGATYRSIFDVILHREAVDPASIAAGAELSGTVTITGAALGDFVRVAIPVDVTDLIVDVRVTAADTVTWLLMNETASPIDLASSTWNFIVEQPGRLWDRT